MKHKKYDDKLCAGGEHSGVRLLAPQQGGGGGIRPRG